jgi:fructosamine-3-kinase
VTALTDAVGRVCGSEVRSLRSVTGGDINEAHRAELTDGRTVFVKTNADAPPGMFAAEAAGLAWLQDADAVRIPGVVGSHDPAALDPADDEGGPRLLVLEWIERAAPSPTHDEQLGRALADLHRFGAPTFGLETGAGNWVGAIAQSNASHATWADFYAHQRLDPLVVRATERGLLPADARARFEVLYERLDDLYPADEPPARLHGDLWGGNAMTDERGAPVLIDPAVYGGHREMDLAMMQLFGGFSPRVFAAYDEVHPRLDGHADRVALHQLHPLLVHTLLFGGSYAAATQRALNRYA